MRDYAPTKGIVHSVLLCVPPSRQDQNSSSVLHLKRPEFAPGSTKVQIPAQRPWSSRLLGLCSLKTTRTRPGRGRGSLRPGRRPEGGSRYSTQVRAARQQLRAQVQAELKNEEAKRSQRQNDRRTGDSDVGTAETGAIPRAVAPRRMNLEGLPGPQTVHTRLQHHQRQLFQTRTLPAVKMASAAAGRGSAYAGSDQAEKVASERIDAEARPAHDAHAYSGPRQSPPAIGCSQAKDMEGESVR